MSETVDPQANIRCDGKMLKCTFYILVVLHGEDFSSYINIGACIINSHNMFVIFAFGSIA